MTLDHVLLFVNGVAYFALFIAYQWTAALYARRLVGAHVAGLTSLVFSALFLLRGFDVNLEGVEWLWRVGVISFVAGNLLVLKAMSTPDHRTDIS